MGLDIGPETREEFSRVVKVAILLSEWTIRCLNLKTFLKVV